MRLIDAEDILNERTVFIPPPEPDDTSDSFTYGKCFPELRYDLFGDAVTLSNNDTPEVGDREVARTVLPSGDLVTSRTKQEIRTSQVSMILSLEKSLSQLGILLEIPLGIIWSYKSFMR